MKGRLEDEDGSQSSRISGEDDVLVDVREIHRITGLPMTTIYQACIEGLIPHYRLKRAVRFNPDEVLACMREIARTAVEKHLREQLDTEPDLGVLDMWGGERDDN